MSAPIECERKLLIRYPDLDRLLKESGVTVSEITQTYLTSVPAVTDRVRKRVFSDKTIYTRTQKIRITALSAEEYESEITKDAYDELLKNADSSKKPVHKTRYVLPIGKFKAEIDIYPFWSKQAVLEVEMESEEDIFTLPDFIEVIRDVTADKRYKNTNLALSVPDEEV